MTSAEFVVWREFLGLDRRWVAKQFGVNEATIRRWEGRSTMPAAAEHAMREWIDVTSQYVATLTITLGKQADARILAPMADCGDLVKGMPMQWHRMIAARVAERTGFPIAWKS